MNEKNDIKIPFDFNSVIDKKTNFFKEVIQKTLLHIHENKKRDILAISDIVICTDKLEEINKKINDVSLINDSETIIDNLQTINNELSSLLKNYGTMNLDDLLIICFGNKIKNQLESDKLDLLSKYFHPTSYKPFKKENKNLDNDINKKTKNGSCFEVSNNSKHFYMKVYGIKVYLYNDENDKGIIVYGVLDDIMIEFINNKYILKKYEEIMENIPTEFLEEKRIFDNFIESLILKDFLIYEYNEIFQKYSGYRSEIKKIKQLSANQNIKDFVSSDLYFKRITLLQLLIDPDSTENQYFAYLLYDLLSCDLNGVIDTYDQTILFNSFSWFIKKRFFESMKNTMQYTNDLMNIDTNKMSLEQQIYLMKAPDTVKAKAISKMKEIKSKSEDSGSKARQYLEGLLKIPFGVYRKEPILNLMSEIKIKFKNFFKENSNEHIFDEFPVKTNYTSLEITNCMKKLNAHYCEKYDEKYYKELKSMLNGDVKTMQKNIEKINNLLKENKNICIPCKTKKYELQKEIDTFIEKLKHESPEVVKLVEGLFSKSSNKINKGVSTINDDFKEIKNYINNIKHVMNNSVHGHNNAKKQIEIILGQWINGEENNGYCIGFEGPPGVGKTTLAKVALSNILKDVDGTPRPFAMIQLGGDSNGSSLHGHNYTYVGSTWGSIVQILIDKKCMNPIILIDEVDKISKTEQGRELVGVLTHLLDQTQNDCFQDKYFMGIDIDVSKALFILSYNDPHAIDKILLDRIHRIKFGSLTLEEKIYISNHYVLPEITKKFGLENMVEIKEDVLKFIIEEYTNESGIRKYKEIIFEIIGEINLDILRNSTYKIPIQITIEDIKNKYFKDKNEIKYVKIHKRAEIGIINALWANSLGQGGVLPLQVKMFPSSKFLDLKLTGSMGDIMKESVNVSLTTAWDLTTSDIQSELIKKYNDIGNNNVYGIHIHCPDCSTPKDGPSATTAFTIAIYSMLNNLKIKNYFGITGETSFDYQLTEIGGLEQKMLGGIKAGITEFIYPSENKKDFEKFIDKYKDTPIISNIKFHCLSNIYQVIDLIIEK